MRDSKRKILESAEKLFAKKGYDAVSVFEIAARAGISKSLVFHHFKTKQNIFLSLIKEKLNVIERQISEIYAIPSLEPKEKLLVLVDTYIELLFKYSSLFKILFREAVNACKSISEVIVEHNAKMARIINDTLSECLQNNQIKDNISIKNYTILLLLTLNSLAAVDSLQKGSSEIFKVDVLSLKEEIKKIFIRGVVKDD